MDNAVAPGGPKQDKVYAFNLNPVGATQGKLMEVTMDSGNEIAGRGDGTGRETWSKKIDFLLSVIGFCVDLANVWRFPYMCYKNGGGAFLIPYLFMLIFMGIPLFYMELALGQYNQTGPITVWDKVSPLFKGVGFAMICIAFFVDFYYNVIISYSIYYLIASFQKVLPWSVCTNSWNTNSCFEPRHGPAYNVSIMVVNEYGNNVTDIVNQNVSAATEYYERAVLQVHMSAGIDDLGKVVWQLALCLFAVYIICYFSLWKGIKGSGKVVWITATLPYVVLFCLLIRGVTLPGAGDGIKYYLIPKWDRLLTASVWVDAATQICFSLGPGFGVLLALSSYNRFNNNIYKDALLTSTINCCTSFLAGFVVFAVLGYMAKRNNQSIDEVATEGPGLVFVTYPEALATMPGANVWSVLFFLMLLTLGLDSSFGGSEAILTGLGDQFPKVVKKHREIFIAFLFAIYFIGLAFTSQGGTYLVNLFDNCAAYYAILFVVLFETLAVAWLYGFTTPTEKISRDIEEMCGYKPGFYWRFCWMFLSPVMIIFIIGFGLANYKPFTLDDYDYPEWAVAVGWLISCTSISMIPIVAAYQIITTPGSISERIMKNLYVKQPRPFGYESNMYTAEQESRMNGMVLEATCKPVTLV
ncbi:LOW QUALITY PROTEIN: sodium-dependent dopamine transporter-like [Strongylocentrotus purpuratus]|uniref:Transporter n=1 Tax=Strongylocentrotus purpuratus TaxID=7668 RepID=A0A7M7PBR0_STRPU|nr:LOW QUALITY PROTEIN: sodium-dependent dopamine transporter-like [Strongylocentrotus purpuratus]